VGGGDERRDKRQSREGEQSLRVRGEEQVKIEVKGGRG